MIDRLGELKDELYKHDRDNTAPKTDRDYDTVFGPLRGEFIRAARAEVKVEMSPKDGAAALMAYLDRFLPAFENEFGTSVSVTDTKAAATSSGRAGLRSIAVKPTAPNALPVQVKIYEDFARFQAGHNGGLWEVRNSEFNGALIEDFIRSVAAGRAVEVIGPGRSTVWITLADGAKKTNSSIDGLLNMLIPRPGWRRRGRRVQYAPYR